MDPNPYRAGSVVSVSQSVRVAENGYNEKLLIVVAIPAFWKMNPDGDGTVLLRLVARKGFGSIPTSSAVLSLIYYKHFEGATVLGSIA